jgi:hypothetical protein
MSNTDAIKVEGLSEFAGAVKEMGEGLPKALKLVLNAAADVVITAARGDVPSRSGRAKSSIRASSTQDKVRVTAGGKKAPHYPWLDYGGEGRRRGRPPARPFIKGGRFLYPAYFKKLASGEFELMLTQGLTDLIRTAGLEVT